MKKKTTNSIILVVILVFGVASCEKNKKDQTDPTEKVRKILELEARMQSLNSGTGKISDYMSVIGYSQFRDGELTISGTGLEPGSNDTIKIDTTDYWAPVTCAKVTESDNEDGTHTTVYDYGDGCDEYGSIIKGKITYVWKNNNNTYYSEVIYDHYYSWGVEMNGTSRYTFTSDGNSFYTLKCLDYSSDTTASTMPVEFYWSGTSIGHEDMTMLYDDGNHIIYRSDFSNVWDSISYKVLQGEYYYKSTSDGYEYHYLVSKPLITDYRCTGTWVPVSGIETITTKENGKTGEYTLNYGNGDCDNLAELTQDGKTSVVDFSEIYRIMEVEYKATAPMERGKK